MTIAVNNSPAARRGKPSRTLRVLEVVLVLCALLLTFGAGLHAWRWYAAPVPPEIKQEVIDPALADAIAVARRNVREHPYSAAAWGELGQLLRDSRLVEPATVCFAQAERLAPDEPRWPYLQGEGLLLRDPDAALPHLERAVALGTQRGTGPLTPRLKLAEVLITKGRHEEAEAHLQRTLEVDPGNVPALFFLGLAAAARGDLEAARTHLLRCQYSPFTQQKACQQLAALYRRQGVTDKAAQYSERARGLPKDLPLPDPYLAVSLATLVGKPARFQYLDRLEAQNRHAEAINLLREMLAEGPDLRAYVGLGRNLAQVGEYHEAEEALRSALRLEPENVQAHYLLGKVLWAQAENSWQKGGDRPALLEQFRAAGASALRALARKPDHALAHMLLGLSLRRLSQQAEGLAELRTAVECGPDLVEPSLYLGEVLAQEGQEAEARQHLQYAQRLAPDDPRPRIALARLRQDESKPD